MENLTSEQEDFLLEEARECTADLHRKYEYELEQDNILLDKIERRFKK